MATILYKKSDKRGHQRPSENMQTSMETSCFLFVLGITIGLLLYHSLILPGTIDRRAEGLNLMRYSHAAGGMVAKDEYKWMLHYLKKGTMQ